MFRAIYKYIIDFQRFKYYNFITKIMRTLSFSFLTMLLLLLTTLEVYANCGSEETAFAGLDSGYSFRTSEGTVINLTSLYMQPSFIQQHPDIQSRITERLNELLSAAPLRLDFTEIERNTDCYAQVVNSNGEWVQEEIIKEGLAIVTDKPGSDKYLKSLLMMEIEGREEKAGVWEFEDSLVVQADELQQTEHDNAYQIIEGNLYYVRDRARVILACMSEDPYKSVCLLILRDTYFEMKENGFDLFEQVGTKIRARGFMFPRGGLKMFIDKPPVIEIRS